MESKKERVRAIIIVQHKLLIIHRIKHDDDYYVLPGGGVEAPESKEEALIRECKEELGIDVRPEKLFFKEKSKKGIILGQQEYFYFTKIVGGVLGNVTGPEFKADASYVGKYIHEWYDMKEIKDIDLRPHAVRDALYNYLIQHEETKWR